MQSTYTFFNNTSMPITFDVFGTEADYFQNTNRMGQYNIKPNENLKVLWDVQKTYWVDWYSLDYSYNNWFLQRNDFERSPAPKITVAALDDNYAITALEKDTLRSIIINGNTMSEWQAKITNAASLNGTHNFTFKKDYTGTYEFVDVNGKVTKTAFTFAMEKATYIYNKMQAFNLTLATPLDKNAFIASCYPGIYPPHTGRDTLLIQFANSGSTNFPAIRQ